MSAERMDERISRWNRVSERLFGEVAEVKTAEAEELLRTAGIDPEELKNSLYRRMRERSETYSGAGRPLPPLLSQALEDLRPISDGDKTKPTTAQTARLAIARLLRQIGELPKLLNTGSTLAFTAAYRNRKELSARDKEVLDRVAEDLRKHAEERKPHE